MNRRIHKKYRNLWVAVLLITWVALLTGCYDVTEVSGTRPTATEVETAVLNDRGTYTYLSIVLPGDGETEKNTPLVVIAHGYTGNRNSGGAEALAYALADEGIASVRMDFNSLVYGDMPVKEDAERTNEYTLSSMVDDMVLGISYTAEHYKIDISRIGVYGRSMGGRAAMIAANTGAGGYDYKAMALIAPAGNENAMIYYMGGQEKWDAMKEIASKEGFTEKQGIKLTPQWFSEFENYNPADGGKNYKNPVLVIYNVQDYVVTPETSLDCAAGYENVRTIEVDTKDYHGYEMGYKESELKDRLIKEITQHFKVLADEEGQ